MPDYSMFTKLCSAMHNMPINIPVDQLLEIIKLTVTWKISEIEHCGLYNLTQYDLNWIMWCTS